MFTDVCVLICLQKCVRDMVIREGFKKHLCLLNIFRFCSEVGNSLFYFAKSCIPARADHLQAEIFNLGN